MKARIRPSRPRFRDFAQSERGATVIEYALIASLISVGIIGGLTAFTSATSNQYNQISTEIGAIMR